MTASPVRRVGVRPVTIPARTLYRPPSPSHHSLRRFLLLLLGFIGCVGVAVTYLSLGVFVLASIFAFVNNSG
jgi:hypothetical protein